MPFPGLEGRLLPSPSPRHPVAVTRQGNQGRAGVLRLGAAPPGSGRNAPRPTQKRTGAMEGILSRRRNPDPMSTMSKNTKCLQCRLPAWKDGYCGSHHPGILQKPVTANADDAIRQVAELVNEFQIGSTVEDSFNHRLGIVHGYEILWSPTRKTPLILTLKVKWTDQPTPFFFKVTIQKAREWREEHKIQELCRQCQHLKIIQQGGGQYWECRASKRKASYTNAHYARWSSGFCGPEGKAFSPKPVDTPNPSQA